MWFTILSIPLGILGVLRVLVGQPAMGLTRTSTSKDPRMMGNLPLSLTYCMNALYVSCADRRDWRRILCLGTELLAPILFDSVDLFF